MMGDKEKAASELVQFLRISAKTELKTSAISHVLGLTSTAAGISFITSHKDILEAVLSLTKDKNKEVSDEAYKVVINLSADDGAAKHIIEDYDVITELINQICDPKSAYADGACKILGNITRTEDGSLKFLRLSATKNEENDELSLENSKLRELIDSFCKSKPGDAGTSLDHVASIIANITQTLQGRKLLLSKSYPVAIEHLSAFLSQESSHTRIRGISMAIKNCCFEHEYHEWLLGRDVEILPSLLLPLAGSEEFSEEENEELPLDLQYLPEDKTREPDPEIRRTLMETLLLLCADTFGRNFLKKSGAYYILRELHTWEADNGPEVNVDECEKVVQVLIADEPEPGMENFMTIPEDKIKLKS